MSPSDSDEFYEISYPEKRLVTRAMLTRWASDDIANGDTDIKATDEELAADINLVIRVLHDAGNCTVRYARALGEHNG